MRTKANIGYMETTIMSEETRKLVKTKIRVMKDVAKINTFIGETEKEKPRIAKCQARKPKWLHLVLGIPAITSIGDATNIYKEPTSNQQA